MEGEQMKFVSRDSITLSRVYFTEFDRVTYSQVAWTAADVEAIRCNTECKLKLVALIKGLVVIAASHLVDSGNLAKERWLIPRSKRRPEFKSWDRSDMLSLLFGKAVSEPVSKAASLG